MNNLLDDLKEKIENALKSNSLFTPIVNIVCPSGAGTVQQDSSRPCLPTELIKNGGFEEGGQFTVFRDWEQTLDNVELFRNDGTAYEGTFSAEFNANTTTQSEEKTAAIRQNIIVTPGCFLALSFADNFLDSGGETDFEDLDVAARVFYTDAAGNRVNLINVEIDYNFPQTGNGFVFHQKVADSPVPFNVSSVTVEFFVQMTDQGGNIQWLLDGVSLRAV